MEKNEELKKIISIPFKRKNQEEISEKSYIFSLALDLNWFSLDEAQDIVEVAKSDNLIKDKEGTLSPNFSIEKIDASISFEPSKNFLKKIKNKDNSILEKIIKKIQAKEDLTRQEIISSSNNIQDELNKLVDIEVAALLFAKERGIEINDVVKEKLSDILPLA